MISAGTIEAFAFFGGFVLANQTSPPNSRRLLRVVSPGYAGVFAAYTADTDDVAGFDLSGWLDSLGNDGESLASVSFVLVPIGPASDAAPATRILGGYTIVGKTVGVRLGAWQPSIPYLMYRLQAIAETSLSNQIEFWAYVPVNAPIA